MNTAHLLKTYRKALNPPYQGKDLLVILATLLILISIPLIVIGVPKSRAPKGRAAYANPTLYLTPATQSVNQNSPFTVQVRVDNQAQSISGVQAYLSYPTDKLDVLSLDYTGTALPTEMESTFGGGSIRMSRGMSLSPPTPVSGDNLIGAITFRAKVGAGPAAVSFVTGSNIVRYEDYTDILVDKIGGTYTVVDPPPAVSITNPANNATIKGTILVQATAADDLGVAQVEFLVDGTVRSTDATAPYEYSLNTTSPVLADGPHTISAKAYDATSSTTATINVVVDNNAPTISITAPAAGAFVRGTAVSVSTTVSDTVGVVKVEFYVDGTLKSTDTTSPFSYSWDTTTYTNASHTLQAKAYDNANNVGTSATISVTVDNIAPTVTINSPASGAYLRGSVSATATPNDANLLNVEFSLDTSLKCTVTASPYTCTNIITASTSDGTHTISAKANDRAGNSTTANISVTVDNTAPTQPTGLNATPASSTQVNLTWTASTDATSGIAGYDVYRNGSKVTPTPVTTTSFSDTGLAVNTNYTYYVQAIDRAGNVSANSNTASATTRVAGDFNGDGFVNMLDFGMLARNWGLDYPPCDVNGDHIVNMIDFGALARNWTG